MNIKTICTGIFVVIAFAAITGCEDKIESLVTTTDFDRAMAPTGVVARVRNLTTIELNWNATASIDHYVVEFSEDSLEFNTIIFTDEVAPDELPYQHVFAGETRYSARVKAVQGNKDDSKWVAATVETSPENIFLAAEDGDIEATEVTLRWPANSEVTRLVVTPGNIEHVVTPAEKTAGVATLTGLTGSTSYTIKLYNTTKVRGTIQVVTLIDLGGAIPINPGDNMKAILDAAQEGDVFVVFPGTYSLGTYTATKSISISGYQPNNKPIIYGQFAVGSAVSSLELKELIVRGDETSTWLGQFFNAAAGCNLTNLSIINCEISNYTNNLIYNNVAGVFGTIKISGSYIHHITGGGGDGIDFRGGSISALTVENSTFANGFRTFLRMQVACNTSFKNCTFYKICIGTADSNNAGLFRANVGGTFEVKNSLFVETGRSDAAVPANGGVWTRSAANMAATPSYGNNNIFSCYNLLSGLYTTASQISATELNPGFVDAAAGNFTITNQTLKDNAVGDPRWRP